MAGFKAVIFDMDGVIVDSERQWKLCEEVFFRSLAPSWSDKDHNKIVGLGVVDLYHRLVEQYGITETKESFLAKCEELAAEIYGSRVTPSEGIIDFISDLHHRQLRLGLASSSPRRWIDRVLHRFDLAGRFEAVASGDDVPGRTKPAPDIYKLVTRLMGVPTGECVAIEDSELGVRSAKAAGLHCAGFRNGHNNEQDLSGADFEFSSFAEPIWYDLVGANQ